MDWSRYRCREATDSNGIRNAVARGAPVCLATGTSEMDEVEG